MSMEQQPAPRVPRWRKVDGGISTISSHNLQNVFCRYRQASHPVPMFKNLQFGIYQSSITNDVKRLSVLIRIHTSNSPDYTNQYLYNLANYSYVYSVVSSVFCTLLTCSAIAIHILINQDSLQINYGIEVNRNFWIFNLFVILRRSRKCQVNYIVFVMTKEYHIVQY